MEKLEKNQQITIIEEEFEASDVDVRIDRACETIAYMLYQQYLKERAGG